MLTKLLKLVILDIDGVMTDGKKTYGLDGSVISKTYCDKDFTAIKHLRASGVNVCFLSGDKRINETMAKNRNIDFYYARGKDKASFLEQFSKLYGSKPSEMLYVGDDLFDLSILEVVGHPFCPDDSPNKIKECCGPSNVIDRSGGQNVVARLVDLLLERKMIPDSTIQQIEKLDKKEIF